MTVSLDDAREASEQAQQGNLRENQAGIPEDAFDYENEDAPIVQGHQESLITFSRIVGFSVFNTDEDFLDVEQNLQGGGSMGYGNDLVLTLEDPELVDGQLWELPDDAFKDYKVIGNPESEANHFELRENVEREDGDVVGAEIEGVDLGMAAFDGQPTDSQTFDTDYIQVLVPSNRAEGVIAALDTAGKWSHDTDGAFTEGILEAPPEMRDDSVEYDPEDHPAPRVIGYPELRADMVGQRGAIAWTYDIGEDEEPKKNSPVNLDVYTITEGEDGEPSLEALVPLAADDDAYAKPTYPRGNGLFWDHDGSGVSADAAPETDADVSDAQDALSGDEPSLSGLSEDGQAFVESAVGVLEETDMAAASDFAEETDAGIGERLESARASGDDIEADADTLATIIDDEYGGGDE